VTVGVDYHGRFLYLFGVVTVNDVHKVKATQGGVTVLPGEVGALALNLGRNSGSDLLEILGGSSKAFGDIRVRIIYLAI